MPSKKDLVKFLAVTPQATHTVSLTTPPGDQGGLLHNVPMITQTQCYPNTYNVHVHVQGSCKRTVKTTVMSSVGVVIYYMVGNIGGKLIQHMVVETKNSQFYFHQN